MSLPIKIHCIRLCQCASSLECGSTRAAHTVDCIDLTVWHHQGILFCTTANIRRYGGGVIFEVPRVDEPGKIIDKIKEYADEHRKK